VQKIRFSAQGGFHETLQKRVRQYFAAKQLPKTGDWRMFLKTGICLTWLATSYVLLVFFAASLTSALLTAFALAQGFILVSCNIMHDGAHDSFSKNKKISWLMGCTLDLMGGSQMLWRQKHNVLHHTYTNINALDSDLHTSGLLRLHPDPFSYRLLVMVVSLAAIFLSTVMLISRLFAVVRGTLAKLSVSALRFDYISVLAMSGEESLA
jgi:linoleoyl-CoA desaturase